MVTSARHLVLAERSQQGGVRCFPARRQEPAAGDQSGVSCHFVLPTGRVTAAVYNWTISRMGYVVAIGIISIILRVEGISWLREFSVIACDFGVVMLTACGITCIVVVVVVCVCTAVCVRVGTHL